MTDSKVETHQISRIPLWITPPNQEVTASGFAQHGKVDFPNLLTWKLHIWADGMSHLACLCDCNCGQYTIQRIADTYVVHSEEKAWVKKPKPFQKKYSRSDVCSKGSAPRKIRPRPWDWEPTKAAKIDLIPHSGKIYSQASWKDPCWEINPLLRHANTGSSSAKSHSSHQYGKLSSMHDCAGMTVYLLKTIWKKKKRTVSSNLIWWLDVTERLCRVSIKDNQTCFKADIFCGDSFVAADGETRGQITGTFVAFFKHIPLKGHAGTSPPTEEV